MFFERLEVTAYPCGRAKVLIETIASSEVGYVWSIGGSGNVKLGVDSVLGSWVLGGSVLGGSVLGSVIGLVIGSVGGDSGTISVSESEDSRYSRYSRPSEAILRMKTDKNR